METLIGNYKSFISNINQGLEKSGIDRSELAMIDHLCYRVETEERYQDLFNQIGKKAVMIGEVEVSGRPIATFEFDQPLEAEGWRVPYLELPAPKEGSKYAEGLEHCEIVVIGDLEKFATRHNNLYFDRKGMNKVINPELSLKTDCMSVKFHEQPLGAVVRIEQRLKESTQTP